MEGLTEKEEANKANSQEHRTIDLITIRDTLNESYSKLKFLSDMFCNAKSFEFSEKSQAGLFHFIEDIADMIGSMYDEVKELENVKSKK